MWRRRASLALSGNKRVIAYSFLAILAVAALALVTTTLRRPQSADVVIDTEIESGDTLRSFSWPNMWHRGRSHMSPM